MSTQLGSWRAAMLRVEGLWASYRRYWRANLYSSGIQPVLFLAAMGMGFGSQVQSTAQTGGVGYVQYIAPAMLLVGALLVGVGESSFPVLSGFQWQRDYTAIVATPITPGQILHGQLLWVAFRVTLSSVVFALIATLFGAWRNPGAVLVVLIGIALGLAVAAPMMAASASTYGDGERLTLTFRLAVMPMMLFSGTFFPVDQLPIVLRLLAWLSPLWHGTELARGVSIGGLELLPGLGHLAYLAAWFVVGVLLARRHFTRRLVV